MLLQLATSRMDKIWHTSNEFDARRDMDGLSLMSYVLYIGWQVLVRGGHQNSMQSVKPKASLMLKLPYEGGIYFWWDALQQQAIVGPKDHPVVALVSYSSSLSWTQVTPLWRSLSSPTVPAKKSSKLTPRRQSVLGDYGSALLIISTNIRSDKDN